MSNASDDSVRERPTPKRKINFGKSLHSTIIEQDEEMQSDEKSDLELLNSQETDPDADRTNFKHA